MTTQPANQRQQSKGVTVTQYQGPDMRFESAEAYGAWLLSGNPNDPDWAVDLHENWDDPSYQPEGEKIIDRMFEEADR